MIVYLASDHAGFKLKERVKGFLIREGYEVQDLGASEYNKDDDYPDFISKAGEAISRSPEDKAIIFGGSGQAEAIVANKYKQVRAAVFYAPAIPAEAADVTGRVSEDPFEMIRLTREHNNANVLSLGARFLKEEEATQAVQLWLKAPFSQEGRHVRRIDKIKKIEEGS
ncbi:RpiB/LacA/LacB family sugar-phosphate isomerase [Candidatus Daviesbacteria bacterium]|nr:RpiB/LacA/LacB family sugar-phosphate isomerase [Candidatus Daviesbacteria bacterium]